MAELKIYVSKELNEKFRRIAMRVFGYGRGSISRAAEDALARWCDGREQLTVNANASNDTKGDAAADTVEAGINPDERVADPKAAENQSTKHNSATSDSS